MPLHLCILFLFLICKRYQFQTNDPAINTENDEELILKDDATLADSKIVQWTMFKNVTRVLSQSLTTKCTFVPTKKQCPYIYVYYFCF